MKILNLRGMTLSVDFTAGHIASLKLGNREMIESTLPLFSIGLRDLEGNLTVITAHDAKSCEEMEDGALYCGFQQGFEDLTARVYLTDNCGEAEWRISVDPQNDGILVEWVEFPPACLPHLRDNAEGGGEILWPYNEGALVSDLLRREETSLRQTDPEYPSRGSYAVFPNMICSQLISYITEDASLYIGAHDEKRGVKAIDYVGCNGGVILKIRLFCGISCGEAFSQDFPIVFAALGGDWQASAERYRKWFESALPPSAKKISENESLPEWYKDSPLVVSYPVRGKWDMDEMSPNALYPYTNALPLIDEIKAATDSRLLVLLMHWEGTAPWAPPYVWPPYGDPDNFAEFKEKLHKNGDLLGVYCSGFGYTIQSNLVESYNRSSDYEQLRLERGMCAGPDGEVGISRICTSQRSGYDVCPASPLGKQILDEAYAPLFESGLDYAQILDQNHGGGQYFCYAKDHGHPHAPGAWMTESMQNMLSEWNKAAGRMLLGCESAAAESFIGNLLFSDNRYELNYMLGRPVPLYAYIYHEYLRNFMGNQVSCRFEPDADTLPYRIAYSFSIGDCMTLVFMPDGSLMPNWSRPRHTISPDKEKVYRLISNLTQFYKEKGSPYLYNGRMLALPKIECDSVAFKLRESEHTVTLPAVLASAWQSEDGKRALILVNPSENDVTVRALEAEIVIPPLNAVLVEF